MLNMETRICSMADLFQGQYIYEVPRYQRQYVWNRSDQWEPLWYDIIEITDRSHSDVNDNHAHFMGAVVLKRNSGAINPIQIWKVIDGQQRITTMQILIATVYQELKKLELEKPAKYLLPLIQNSTGTGQERFKVRHNDESYKQFRDLIGIVIGEQAGDFSDGPIADCFDFFSRKIRKWFDTKKADQLCFWANAIVTTLLSRIQLAGIFLNHTDQEHLIFETLNARGEPLTEWDKVKNYLLYKADTNKSVDQSELYSQYLVKFDSSWWRDTEGRGAQARPRTDIFLDYWLESRTCEFVNVKRVFKEFKSHTETCDDFLEEFIKKLFDDANYYQNYSQVNDNSTSYQSQFHTRRSVLSLGAIWPLLLCLKQIPNTEVFSKCLSYLDSYFVRRKICGLQARGYDKVSMELLRKLKGLGNGEHSNECSPHTIIRDELLRFKSKSEIWPKDIDIENSVLSNNQSNEVQKMLLKELELNLNHNLGGYTNLSKKIQLEHIMPKSWSQVHWPMENPEVLEDVENRNKLIETLGNLTLLNSKLNNVLSNGPWTIKSKAIEKHDNLQLNRHLLKNFIDWNEESIKKRGKWMAEWLIEIWPRPTD